MKKNLYLLPTDKPSRLIIYSILLNEFRLLAEPIEDWNHKRHIYITSDEEIKEGDWVIKKYGTKFPESKANEVLQVNKINTNNGYLPNGNYYNFSNYLTVVVYDRPFQGSNDNDISRKSFNNGFKKIILTTDPVLIKNGLQAIDDKFLEWFVMNPSCEKVDFNSISRCCGRCNGEDDLCFTDMTCDNHKERGCEICYGKRVEYLITIPKEGPKQETLGEAAERIRKKLIYAPIGIIPNFNDGFEEGTKWQQEQDKKMYSAEELKSWLVHRDVYLYNYYTTYIKSGIPLQSVEDFIKESHEYLMDRKQSKKK